MVRSGTIIITGASGKLGKIMTKHLLSKNWEVFAITSSEKSSKLLLEKNNHDPSLSSVGVDLLDNDQFKYLLNSKLSKINNLYGIIHNARSLSSLNVGSNGISESKDFIDEFSLAVTIPYQLTMYLQEKGLSRVVCISSQYGIVSPNPRLYEDGLLSSPIQYGVAKSAQIHLVKELAVRLAEKKILVNAIALGGIEGRVDNKFKDRYANYLPLRRMLNEKEILPAIDYLIDPLNTAATGSTVLVDGGWTIQ